LVLSKSVKYTVVAIASFVALLAFGDVLRGQAGNTLPASECMGRDPILLNGIVVTDFLIFVSYTVIPALMIVALSLRDDLFRRWRWLVVLYAAFIFTCGLAHLIDALTIVTPRYFLLFLSQAACAIFSVATMVALLTYYRDVLENVPNVDDLVHQVEAFGKVVQSRDEMERALERLKDTVIRLNGQLQRQDPRDHEGS
jgi:hypothetical protein